MDHWKENNKQRISDYNRYQTEWRIYNRYVQEGGKQVLRYKKKTATDWEEQIFDSAAEAAKALNIQSSGICMLLKGKLKSTGGYVFERITISAESVPEPKTWEEIKVEKGYDQVKPSKKRKLHFEVDGVLGKTCGKCEHWYPLDTYCYSSQSWDKKRNTCDICLKQDRKDKKEYISAYNKKYWQKTKESQLEKNREWRQNNRDRYRKYMAVYMREWEKNKRETDPSFKLIKNQRTRVWQALKGKTKPTSTINLLGCSISELREHLEKKFDEKMSWDNYGTYWHVDHILPCACWDFNIEEELFACFHYTNLQPLEASENIIKKDSFDPEDKRIALQSRQKLLG